MNQKITGDGSVTFYNEEYGETYHSNSGAKEESVEKYIKPSWEYVKHLNKFKILDFCFGLGYNTAAAIDFILEKKPDAKIEVVGLENDPVILNEILNIEAPYKCFDEIKKAVKGESSMIKIIVGDAATVDFGKGFDLVFFDPFSPKRCPRLWTEEIFQKVFDSMLKGVLTTYSCARVVRDNLKAVGFVVKDGPCVARRAPSTIAIKK